MSKSAYKNILLVIAGLLLVYLNFWGIDRLVLGSDELHPTRALVSDDWSLTHHPWPEEGIREYYNNWPIQFPPIFGLMVRSCIVLMGPTHFALRFIPALFSLFAVFAFYALFKQYLSKNYALVSAISAAMLSDKVLIYAKSLKHYTLDILFSAIMLMMAKRLGEKNDTRSWVIFTLVAAASVWFGFASIYVVAAVYVYMFARYVWKKSYRGEKFWLKIILSGSIFSASFIGLYFTVMVHAVNNPVLLRDWSVMIFDWQRLNDLPFVFHYIAHVGKHILILPAYYFFDSLWVGILCDVLIAIWIIDRLRSKAWDQVLLLTAPMFMALLASLAGKYPFAAARTTLFLVPSWTLMIALGTKRVYDYLRERQIVLARIATALAILLVVWGVGRNAYKVYILKYAGGRHVDKLIYTLKDGVRDGDTAYLHWGAIQPFYYYYTDLQPGYKNVYPTPADSGQLQIIWGEEHTFHPELNGPLFQRIESVPGRLWIVFGHLWPFPDQLELKERLDKKRTLIQEWDFKGCHLLLYDRLSIDEQGQNEQDGNTLE